MALIRRIGFTRFNRWGDNLGRLAVSAATHTDALDGTDELKITCAEDLTKGDRVVWIDLQGVCHEHIVDSVERTHDDDGAPKTQATCINSINETWDDWVDDKVPSGGVSVALTSILSGIRWEVGTCDQPGSASRKFYHKSVRECLADIIETWGGELETLIVHDGARIVSRRVGVRSKRGNQSSAKRFTWTKDLVSVKRSVASDNPATRVYGYGKGVETDGGGYGRRLTFGDINGGKDYVEDAEATAIWGHPDGKGGILPAVASYVNEQCEDAAQLLQETQDYLEKVKDPKVTYTASVIDLYAFGRSWEGVGVGDDVAIIDKGFSDEGVRLHGRVSQIKRDLLTADTTVTFGTLTDSMADMWQSVSNALKSNSQQNALYDAAAGTSVSWLKQLQAAFNAQFNAVGNYHVEKFEFGEIWSNVPVSDDTGLPIKATANMWAVNIGGMGIRLAANLTSDGQWDWRTFVTGAGVDAGAINTGTMRADRVRAGLLTDDAGDNYWDLSAGEMVFKRGFIRSADNKSVWDLANNAITLDGGTIKGSTIEGSTLVITTKNGAKLVIDASSSTIDITSGTKHLAISAFQTLIEDTSSGHEFVVNPYGITVDSGTEKMFSWNTPGKLVISTAGGVLADSNSPIALYDTSSSKMRFDGCAIFSKGNLNNFRFVWNVTSSCYVEIQTLYGTYGITAWASDANDKENIADSDYDATSAIRSIRHRSFKFKDVEDEDGNVLVGQTSACGYIAQEMAEIDQRFAFTVGDPDDGGRMQIDESAIIPVLSKAIQEIDERLRSVESRVDEIEGVDR